MVNICNSCHRQKLIFYYLKNSYKSIRRIPTTLQGKHRQYFGHLIQTDNSLEKPLLLGKTEGKRRREKQRMRWLGSITNSMNLNLSKLQEIVKDKEALHAAVPGVTKIRHNLVTEQQQRQIFSLEKNANGCDNVLVFQHEK